MISTRGLLNSQNELVILRFQGKVENSAGIFVVDQVDLYDANVNRIESQITTNIEATQAIPVGYGLLQNYPNPFNPRTAITYQLPQCSLVRLTVYNSAGQPIQVLVNGEMPAGEWSATWDGQDQAGNNVSSGIYFYRLEVGDGLWVETKKMVLMR